MKNLLFGLTAVGMALGLSAFTNAPKELNRFDKTYYQLSNGTYVSTPPTGVCQSQNSDPCIVNYIGSTPSAEGWSFADRPAGTIETSGLGYRQ
ncbi:hypothetical protein [Pedobacter psychroterrae]|uniref:Uncharacterized protein n=1 Tax=Pedobacter psychroterrae TaxID=2530453 RepID=A0A4R0NQ51_9SPHI|nr:hypothetical protein [Pedobacter psychroterrae]TCD03162.1 hypothetical protein EZ437_04080 [Pedobacter psychroterrae]